MKILQYLQTSEETILKYIADGLVDYHEHERLPLAMLTYGRKAVYDNHWDDVTTKCRGVIFNTETDEIIARPFEKFFNLSSNEDSIINPTTWTDEFPWMQYKPRVDEKLDGFLCILYEWDGKSYIASKGSFDSPHAKWATQWYREHVKGEWPKGYTPVFEGITPNLRIVVDYGPEEKLVLLALINNETGEEMSRAFLRDWAEKNSVSVPQKYEIDWKSAHSASLNPDSENFEGYVLVWQRPNQTPFRLKVKYQDYLRIHRMVSGVSPKAILNCLEEGRVDDLREWFDKSTPWFSHFVDKWVTALRNAYAEIFTKAEEIFETGTIQAESSDIKWNRRAWAGYILLPENKRYSAILFALLDGKDPAPFIWKMVKPMTKNSYPLVDKNL